MANVVSNARTLGKLYISLYLPPLTLRAYAPVTVGARISAVVYISTVKE